MMINNSNHCYKLLKKVTPTGCQTLSKMPERFVEGVYPKVLERGYLGHVQDVDGNYYIDLISGLGAVSVGYCIPAINNAVKQQLEKGVSFSLPTSVEYVTSKKLIELVPWTDQWKFGKNGTDGTLMAIRAARAYTGRIKILTLGYHGCNDIFECVGTRKAGMLDLTNSTIKMDIKKDYIPDELREFAAIIIEPDCGLHLKYIRYLCTNYGIVLIFDEVVTGGRYEKFTGASYFEVQPDLIVLGKGIANGFPLCAVGGSRRIMSVFECNDFFASSTFGGETISLAACLATLDCLKTSIPETVKKGQMIKNAFNGLDWKGAVCKGYPTRLTFNFPKLEDKALFMQEMCKCGVLIGSTNFVMTSHTYKDIDDICKAILGSYHAIQSGVKLEGSLPIQVIRN